MEESSEHAKPDLTGIQVAVRVRPLNPRELNEGHRVCVSFDDPTKQVVLTAVDKSTLFQLRGQGAKGYAFDRRYEQTETSNRIYQDCVAQLVESCFKGYNATVLAYGQTGSGKTHTMAGGIGIHGIQEDGVTPLVIRDIFAITESLRRKAKAGEKVIIKAYGLELYNEELRDLACPQSAHDNPNWGGKDKSGGGLKLLERPAKDGRIVPEVVGIKEVEMNSAEELMAFFNECVSNRSVSSTKLNDRSSRSHAIFTITINRTIITVMNELDENFKAKVRTEEVSCKLHLVDLAGSERVKRSGVTGKELKEATHINSGLLALGNVIVALAGESEKQGGKKGHVPYRDSKLTRLLQDSLGGNSLTVLISCISPSEQDFEETNNTLKYANRACKIKNSPLPNRFTALEEDLLPMLPSSNNAGFGLVQLQALLEEHGRLKEVREKREKDKKEKDAKRLQMLSDMKESEMKTPGFRRLRAAQYDELRRQVASRGGNKKTSIPTDVVIADDTLAGLRRKQAIMTTPVTSPPVTPQEKSDRPDKPGYMRGTVASRVSRDSRTPSETLRISSDRIPSARTSSRDKLLMTAPASQTPGRQRSSFADWMASQEQEDEPDVDAASELEGLGEDYTGEEASQHSQDGGEPISSKSSSHAGEETGETGEVGGGGVEPEAAQVAAPEVYVARGGPSASKSKFKRPARPSAEGAAIPSVPEASELGPNEDGTGDVPPEVNADELAADPSSEMDDDVDAAAEEDIEDDMDDLDTPKMLARFRVNQHDTLAVFKANTKEDFKDVIGLLPENTPLPASDKMTYLLARLETSKGADLTPALQQVGLGNATMNEVVGPAVGCLMATFGTNMIASCIFDFDDPPELELYAVDERIELWGLQIPHNSVRPTLQDTEGDKDDEEKEREVIHWTSVDRLNMSIGLLYALCNYAIDNDVRCGFCVPRPQLLRRWLQAGVKMNQITGNMRLIYPPTAHDYEYYKTSTVAYFMVDEVKGALEKVISIVE